MRQATRIRNLLLFLFLVSALSATAASPRRGENRLRELAVVPQMQLTFKIGFSGMSGTEIAEADPAEEIRTLSEELKSHGEDAERLLRLGALLDKAGQKEEATKCFQKAEKILRKQSELRPQDGLILISLAEAVAGLDRREEALHLCRRATQISPREWKCWTELGSRLDAAFFGLWEPGRVSPEALKSPQGMTAAIREYRPSVDALERTESSIKEAGECFNRAVELAPQESEAFVARASHFGLALAMDAFSQSFRNDESPDAKDVIKAFYSEAVITNLQHASALSPKNCRLVGLIPFLEWCGLALLQGDSAPTPGNLPDDLHGSFRQAIARLDDLSRDPDKQMAAGALETGAMLRFMMSGDMVDAKPGLIEAVALDPAREQAWEMLLGATLSSSDSKKEMISLCERRLRTGDSTRNRLLLAKAFAADQQWDSSIAEARIAARREPDDIVAQLMLVALAIRQSTNDNSLMPIAERLGRIRVLVEKMPAGEERDGRLRELALNAALVIALTGNVELARSMVEKVIEHSPDDEVAKEILAALPGA